MSVVSLQDIAFKRFAQIVSKGHSIEIDDIFKDVILQKISTTDLPTAILFLSGEGPSDMRSAALQRLLTTSVAETKNLHLPKNLLIGTAAALYMSNNAHLKKIGLNQIKKNIPYQPWVNQPVGQQIFKVLSSNELVFSKHIDHNTLLTLANLAARPDLSPSPMLFLELLTSKQVVEFGNEKPESLKSIVHLLIDFADKGFDEATNVPDLLIVSSQPTVRQLPNIEYLVEVACQSSSHASVITNLCNELSERNSNNFLEMHPSIKSHIHSILEKIKPGISLQDIDLVKSELSKTIDSFDSVSSSIMIFENLFHSPDNNIESIAKIAYQSSHHALAIKNLLTPLLQDEFKYILQNNIKVKKQIEIIFGFVKANGNIAQATQMMNHSINLILQIYKPAT